MVITLNQKLKWKPMKCRIWLQCFSTIPRFVIQRVNNGRGGARRGGMRWKRGKKHTGARHQLLISTWIKQQLCFEFASVAETRQKTNKANINSILQYFMYSSCRYTPPCFCQPSRSEWRKRENVNSRRLNNWFQNRTALSGKVSSLSTLFFASMWS